MSTGIGDFLKGGTTSASFKDAPFGTSYTGTVISAEPVQARDYDSSELKFWDDGKPMMQICVTIQTDLRDPSEPDDDGKRGVYIKAWGDNLKALKKAIREAGDDDIRPGGKFTVTLTGEGEAKSKKHNPPKFYSYSYQKPSGAAALLKAEPVTAATPAQFQAPATGNGTVATQAFVPAPAAPAPAPAEVDPAYAAFLAYQASQSA